MDTDLPPQASMFGELEETKEGALPVPATIHAMVPIEIQIVIP